MSFECKFSLQEHAQTQNIPRVRKRDAHGAAAATGINRRGNGDHPASKCLVGK